MYARIKRNSSLIALVGIAAALLAAPAAGAPMEVTKLGPNLCKAVHGGKFVDIPGFPGERIDRRLLPDIHWMVRRFHIFITDGYSTDPVHAPNGEHPIGLATDIVPGQGGNWHDIGHLAHLAEPQQNEPIMPWRWVGWNGDPGHGRGNHLHLSWSHSPSEPRNPARVVYTRICPTPRGQDPGGGSGHHHHHRHHHHNGHHGGSGGVDPSGGGGSGSGSGSGGVGGKTRTDGIGRLAPVVVERY